MNKMFMYIHARAGKRYTVVLFLVTSFLLSITTCAKVQIENRDASENSNIAPVANSHSTDDSSSSSNTESKMESANCSQVDANSTECKKLHDSDQGYMDTVFQNMSENKGALLRTLYVTLGLTGVVIAYFIVRGVLLRRRRTKSRKYGIIAQHGDRGDMEMEPLGDGDDDDDDYTVFELNGTERKQ